MNSRRFGWMRRYGLALIAGLLAASLFVAACGPSGSDATLRIGIDEETSSSNSWAIYGPDSSTYNAAVYSNRHPVLAGFVAPRYDWVPSLADGLPPAIEMEADGGYSVTVPLRDDFEWSDGEAIDANDVEFTVQTALELDLPGNWASLIDPAFVTKAEAIDDNTIKYYFQEQDDEGEYRKPGLSIWQFGAAGAPILPEHYWEPIVAPIRMQYAAGESATARLALFGAGSVADEPTGGPVGFVNEESGAFISFDRNDRASVKDSRERLFENGAYEATTLGEVDVFYGTATGDVELDIDHPIDAERVIYSVYGTPDAAVLALQEGEIDYYYSPAGLSKGLADQVKEDDELVTFVNPSNGYRYFGFNTRDGRIGESRAFRQAVATLIDKERIAQMLQGAISPLYTTVPEGNSFWYNPDVMEFGRGLSRQERVETALELLAADTNITWETEPSWDADAEEVVAGTGLMYKGELVPEMDGISVTQAESTIAFTALQQSLESLKEFGFPVNHTPLTFNELLDNVFNTTEYDFDFFSLSWSLTPFPDHLSAFYVEAATDTGGFNPGGWVNEEFEDLSEELGQATELEEARRIIFEQQELIARELPVVAISSTPITDAYRDGEIEFAFTDVLDGIDIDSHLSAIGITK